MPIQGFVQPVVDPEAWGIHQGLYGKVGLPERFLNDPQTDHIRLTRFFQLYQPYRPIPECFQGPSPRPYLQGCYRYAPPQISVGGQHTTHPPVFQAGGGAPVIPGQPSPNFWLDLSDQIGQRPVVQSGLPIPPPLGALKVVESVPSGFAI